MPRPQSSFHALEYAARKERKDSPPKTQREIDLQQARLHRDLEARYWGAMHQAVVYDSAHRPALIAATDPKTLNLLLRKLQGSTPNPPTTT